MTTKSNTTNTGVLSTTQAQFSNYDESDAAEAFLNRWEDNLEEGSSGTQGKEVSNTEEAKSTKEIEEDIETTEEAEENTEDEDTESNEGESEETEDETEDSEADESEETEDNEDSTEESKATSDDVEVDITVDGAVKKVPLKDLKRLYGQEASLTRKSQEVAAQRKEAEAQATKFASSLDILYQRAQAKWEPYSKIDMLVASKELDTEQFQALRKEAQEAYEEFQFVSQEADNFMKHTEQQRLATLKKQADEALPVLKKEIPNWSNDLYDKIRAFAIDYGLPPEAVNSITNPHVIRMMNDARILHESKKVVLKKKTKTPTKVLKAGSTTSSDLTVDKSKASLEKLRRSGDTDDAAEAFLSRWAS